MTKQDDLNQIIAAAAQAALGPLGCRRKGRSRTWISDQRFWAIQIEFQSSSRSRGSYLNVGASWLWYPQEYLAFDAGYRIGEFISFENREQFTPLIEGMAVRAAEEVLVLRERFKSLHNICDYLFGQLRHDIWSVYYAAVAAGLLGDMVRSRELFGQIEAWATNGPDWQQQLKLQSAALSRLLDDSTGFREAVSNLIQQCRALNGLPPDPNCLEPRVLKDFE